MLKSNFGMKRYLVLTIGLVLAIAFSVIGNASFAQTPTQTVPGQPSAQPTAPTGPSVDGISTTYRPPKKDPFLDERLIKQETQTTIKAPKAIEIVPPPSYEEREAEWQQRRKTARANSQPEPSPSERFLIDEVAVLGLFKKPEGQGVFLKPKPTQATMIFATVGQKFYNGSIRRIDVQNNQVEFEQVSRLSNGTTKSESRAYRFDPRQAARR
jgi:hypothetical protein